LANWASTGLPLAAHRAANPTVSSDIPSDASSPNAASQPAPRATNTHPESAPAEPSESEWRHYLLGELSFRIQYPLATVKTRIHPVLAHLETTPAAVTTGMQIEIDIHEEEGLFQLHCGNEKSGQLITDRELVPQIYQLILIKAYESSGCLAGLHAGAVSIDGRCLLFPATPGSGKSTLVAALMSAGATYLTDELVLLMPDSALRPLPISLGLKKGSWPLFTPSHPELDRLPVHVQADGTKVRYLSPTSTAPQVDTPGTHLHALIFPRYAAGSQTQLTPISTAKAFYRLAAAGYAVPGDLTPEVVTALLDWISCQECYELQVGDLDHAVSTVKELLA
jgi:hypothetical protein